MMKNDFPPNMNPNLFSFLAVTVGYAIVQDFNTDELNSIGNWIILVGQYLLTVASEQQLIEDRIENNNININSYQAKHGGSVYTSSNGKSNQNTRLEVEYLLEALKRMQKELDELKKKKNL